MSTYTASSVFLRALVDAGITHAFVNWGSDHPALLADLERQRADGSSGDGSTTTRPEIITCPNEMVALSSAQGFAQVTGKPAAVIVHVDVGTQSLAGAVHNVDRNRCPVIIYAGASPFSAHGEHKGGRNEWIMWMQDIPDQSSIVRQYVRHVAQLNSAQTVPGTVRRAIQVATSEPKGPVYIWARREVMEEEVTPSLFHSLTGSTPSSVARPPKIWPALSPSALAPSTASLISQALVSSTRPLIITSHLGRNPNAVNALVELSTFLVIPVLQVCPSVVSVPASHPFGLGTTFLTPLPAEDQAENKDDDHPYYHLTHADTILVIDSDLPWIPSIPYQRPSPTARILVMDGGDPLKTTMKMSMGGGGIGEAEVVVRADAEVGLGQILEVARVFLADSAQVEGGREREKRAERLKKSHARRFAQQDTVGTTFSSSPSSPSSSPSTRITYTVPAVLTALRTSIERLTPSRGKRTLVLNESITNFPLVWEYMRPDSPAGGEGSSMMSSGGSSLGWALGGAVGASLGGKVTTSDGSRDFDLIVAIVGDGSFMFGVPSSAYWMARRHDTPFLTIVLNNGGWKAPKLSMLSVHPTLHLPSTDPSLANSKDNEEEYTLANIPGDRLSTGFGPHPPDYVGIAKAASAGWAWGTRVGGDISTPASAGIPVKPTATGAPNAAAGNSTQTNGEGDDGGRALLERSIEEGIKKVLEERRCVVLDCVLEGF